MAAQRLGNVPDPVSAADPFMRFPFALLLALSTVLIHASVIVINNPPPADATVPVASNPIDDQNLALGSAAQTLDLSTHFALPGVNAANIVQITTSEGVIFAELLPTAAPNTVKNFLSYVKLKAYNGSFIHRAAPGFVVQGGGYKADANLSLTYVQQLAAVNNEYNLPNTRGTLAMAKLDGQPNSATNQWFVNLVDNTNTLGTDNNGGFTVFARVLGNGMTVVDTIANLPQLTQPLPSPFENLPLDDWLPDQNAINITNLITMPNVTANIPIYPSSTTSPAVLAFSVQNTNPAVVTATLKGGALILAPGKSTGSALITVHDRNGNFADTPFTVTVTAPVKTTPVNQTVIAGQSATFAITPAAEGSTYQWLRKAAGTTTWVALEETESYSGTTGATLTLAATTTAMSGDQFQCRVTTGITTVIRGIATLNVTPVPLATQTNQKTHVAASLSLDLSGGTPGGLTYYATGLPAGLTINPATGQINGTITAKPGTYTATYWSQNGTLKSAPQTVTFKVIAFPVPMVASYETLLTDADSVPVGKLELTVTATGAFTGRLTCADVQSYALRGQLTLNADYSIGIATLSIPRPAQPASPFSLVLNFFNNTSFASELDRLDPNVAPVFVGSSVYTDSVTVPPAKATGAAWLGTYTLALGNPENLDSSTLDSAVTPAGIGYASAKIATNGLMSLKGKTADGTPFTASLASSYGSDYGTGYLATYRAYIKPYKAPNGYLAGWIYMVPRGDSTNDNPVYHAFPTPSSDFYWFKPANSADKNYREGFDPVGLTISVEPWKSTVSLAGTYPLAISQAGLDNSGGNSDHLPTALALSSTYATTLAAPSDLANPSGWSVKINPATGVFTGSFNVRRTVNSQTVTLKVPVEGVVQQLLAPASATPFAQGFFLLPPNSDSGPTPISGRVELVKP